MRNFHILLCTIFASFSCNYNIESKTEPVTQKLIDFKAFSITVPSAWDDFKFDGIDSYVGGITNGKDTLIFDYGWYSSSFQYVELDSHLFAIDTVNGKMATIIKPRYSKNGTTGVYISNAYKENHFCLAGGDLDDIETTFNIFKSIEFMDSDTSIVATSFAEKFEHYDHPPIAKMTFKSFCSPCHGISNDTLLSISGGTNHNPDFTKWFSDTLFVYSSAVHGDGMAEYHRNLMSILSKDELNLIKHFIQNNKGNFR